MARHLHPLLGGMVLGLIVSFWLATLVSELFGTPETVAWVKTAIPWGFLLLVPALAAAGGTGTWLAGRRSARLLDAKQRRLRWAALNGLGVLMPAAFFLAAKARVGAFDGVFYAVQSIELIAGALNIALLTLSARDGLRLSGRLRAGVTVADRR
ncbi:MAG: hypothetical protein EA356_12965 [Geminicoccaceae bacterium]|nr:MAG: hypothetical protein EA356_12965 [Geminicoccaceae bacterium]